jgi:hypothetical protein
VNINFEKQTVVGKKLCIVENGDALGYCAQVGFRPHMLLASDAHPSAARNVGLAALRDLGEDTHFSCMDDDDFYGPYYQQEHLNFAERKRVTGKMPNWVRFEAVGKLWLFNRTKAQKPVAWVQGPTIGGYARDVKDFPIVDLGEELDFCLAHRRAGGSVFSTSVGHFCYMRSQDVTRHLYQTSARSYANVHGPWFEEHPDDLSRVLLDTPPFGSKKSYLQCEGSF